MEDKSPELSENVETDVQDIGEHSSLGTIRINNEVVATIVRMATLEVPGVVSLAGGSFQEIRGLLSGKRDSSTGIRVEVNESGEYVIGVKVILQFGENLANVGEAVQIAVRDAVKNMTNNAVAAVDVIIDGVRHPEQKEAAQEWVDAPSHS